MIVMSESGCVWLSVWVGLDTKILENIILLEIIHSRDVMASNKKRVEERER